MDPVGEGSIYFWMYTQGLKHEELSEVVAAVYAAGKTIRKKDEENYWRGYYNSDLYHTGRYDGLFKFSQWMNGPSSSVFLETSYGRYPEHPYNEDMPDRWVPCNKDNKPMIKWGQGCMSMTDAMCYPGQVYLAENLKGCNRIVIDCDGDHSEKLDMETISFLWRYSSMTHTLVKPKQVKDYKGYGQTGLEIPASFHLTFRVDKVIPTMHFPYANIDIVGNRANSLRYLKNKKWNHLEPAMMTEEIWRELQEYIMHRKER